VRVTTAVSLLFTIAVAALLSSCATFRPLLSNVAVAPAVISPNADGVDDVTHLQYRIGRSADVSIYFTGSDAQRHYFRNTLRRSAGAYDVYWGGAITDPQIRIMPGGGQALVESQVLPAGDYQWTVEAVDAATGESARQEGRIRLEQTDNTLPELHNFTVVPQVFSPNQDGLKGNKVAVSYYLTKKVERITLYLINAVDAQKKDVKYYISPQESDATVEPTEKGYHGYRYDGGVDLNAEPPPDGLYTIFAEAEDKVGNRVVVTSSLTIKEGGKPRAEVTGGEIDWKGDVNRSVSLSLGQSLCFTATVANIGPVPIRTAGPWPGQKYRFGENNNTLAAQQKEDSFGPQAGVWRFGVNFDTTGTDFPYRWAVGRPQDLEKRTIDGTDQYYLLPGHRGQVSGCIQFDQAPPIGTQYWWGGLIQESVQVANNDVDRINVIVGKP
jgi:hypothetical protein